jgi:hypothetical protein
MTGDGKEREERLPGGHVGGVVRVGGTVRNPACGKRRAVTT